MLCTQIWNIEQEKDREGRGRPAKLNEKKGNRGLEREIKNMRHYFVGRTTGKFCSGGDKMGNASGHQCKVNMSGSEKKVNENSYDISSIKHVTKNFVEVSRCSRAKQRQRNVQKKCAARAKLLFLLIRPIVVFHLSAALPPFEQTINVIESFAFSPG